MPKRWSWYDRMGRPEGDSLRKLLGDLEAQVVELMWRRGEGGEATVRDIATEMQRERPVAYTTVMTVMVHLAEKGLLTRTPLDGKTHLYRVALSREEFLARESRKMVEAMMADFGDLALTQFLQVVEGVDPRHLDHLRKLAEEAKTSPEPESQP